MNYIDTIADRIDRALPDGLEPPERAQQLYRIYALLVLVRGTRTSLEDVHDAWSVWMAESSPVHRSLVPFAALDRRTQLADSPYLDVIRTVAAAAQDQALGRWSR